MTKYRKTVHWADDGVQKQFRRYLLGKIGFDFSRHDLPTTGLQPAFRSSTECFAQ